MKTQINSFTATNAAPKVKKPHQARKACFMLVIFFRMKNKTQFYTPDEIEAGENRKQFDSYDFTYTKKKKRVIDHQVALNKLLKFAARQTQNMYGAYIINPGADKIIYKYNSKGERSMTATVDFYYNKETENRHCIGVNTFNLVDVPVKKEVMPVYTNLNLHSKSLGNLMKQHLGMPNM